MTLADVKRAIERSVQAEADAVLEAARAEGAQVVANARASAAQNHALFALETERIKEELEHRELAVANTARKAAILRAKRDALDHAFRELEHALDTMTGLSRERVLDRLAAQARLELGTIALLRCDARDVQALAMRFPEARVQPDTSVHGGLIAEDAQGAVRVDLTYRSLLTRMREDDLTMIAGILFGTSGTQSEDSDGGGA